jgi:hypothetical protein
MRDRCPLRDGRSPISTKDSYRARATCASAWPARRHSAAGAAPRYGVPARHSRRQLPLLVVLGLSSLSAAASSHRTGVGGALAWPRATLSFYTISDCYSLGIYTYTNLAANICVMRLFSVKMTVSPTATLASSWTCWQARADPPRFWRQAARCSKLHAKDLVFKYSKDERREFSRTGPSGRTVSHPALLRHIICCRSLSALICRAHGVKILPAAVSATALRRSSRQIDLGREALDYM